jgi:hypothetical protein
MVKGEAMTPVPEGQITSTETWNEPVEEETTDESDDTEED